MEDEFRELLARIRQGHSYSGHETVRMRRDGTLIDVEISAAPIRDVAGNATAHMAVFTDISDRKRHEEELRASRARIVAAGDDARRKLERNLHDGAQQRLVALSVSLRLAESRLAEDPGGSATMLAAAREELMRALEELRELARGIHPAILTDRGLERRDRGARRPHAAAGGDRGLRRSSYRLPWPRPRTTSSPRRSPTSARYSGASTARVRIARDDGRVVIEVADDGAGGADPAQGSGLRGLADRVAALDGTLSVASPPGRGTAVRAEIPISDASGEE